VIGGVRLPRNGKRFAAKFEREAPQAIERWVKTADGLFLRLLTWINFAIFSWLRRPWVFSCATPPATSPPQTNPTRPEERFLFEYSVSCCSRCRLYALTTV